MDVREVKNSCMIGEIYWCTASKVSGVCENRVLSILTLLSPLCSCVCVCFKALLRRVGLGGYAVIVISVISTASGAVR